MANDNEKLLFAPAPEKKLAFDHSYCGFGIFVPTTSVPVVWLNRCVDF